MNQEAEHPAVFSALIQTLITSGDAFVRRVAKHSDKTGAVAEQFHRDTGVPQGAGELTWSHASVLTLKLAHSKLFAN